MESTINQRIDELIKQMRMNPKAFAESIEKTPTTIYTVLSGRNKPGYEVIEAILKKYPQINSDWLIKGEGEMFRQSPAQVAVPAENEYLLEHLKQLETNFTRLSSQLEKKDQQIANKDEQIASLSRMLEKSMGKDEADSLATSSPEEPTKPRPLGVVKGCYSDKRAGLFAWG